jgi:GNAT superfamily N-acetyltransferase
MIETERICLRPAAEPDDKFLLEVYAGTRAEELARVPWSPEQQDAFLAMQFAAQKQHYAALYPGASHDIICVDNLPAGRLYLARTAEAFHVVDITLLPQYRNQGIGSFLLRRTMQQAAMKAMPVTIYVETFNPSLRLFARLGFQSVEEKGFHFLMKWTPPAH